MKRIMLNVAKDSLNKIHTWLLDGPDDDKTKMEIEWLNVKNFLDLVEKEMEDK